MADQRIPVTVLSGSLGAGKTTVLNHVLTADHGLEVAVVVNDMGEVNVDAEHVTQQSDLGGEEEVVEMSNGCICCRLRGDMLEEIGRLADRREFDYLLVESSGISEPIPVAQTFALGFEDAEFDPTDTYRLDTMVTVVNAHSFWESFDSGSALAADRLEEHSGRVPEEILLDQIEFCDVLLLNKRDLVPDDELEEIEAVLERLQPRAKLARTEFGNVDPGEILGTDRFDFQRAQNAAGWKHELQHDHHHDPQEEHGVTSFVYHRQRPFHPERIAALLSDVPDEVVRAKGFFWSAGREDVAMGVDKAGTSVRAGPAGTWLADLPKAEREQDFAARPDLKDDWDEEYGDRMTRLVFIAREFDEHRLVDRLDDCLLTDAEMDEDWNAYTDPFEPQDRRELALSNQ
ncbi:GTP-binding protein [Natronobacterium gregoryi]|uniref:GTP-binding protein n=2 Tax=Natronobacterium gregoryi TaxID=44930 RepID=L0AH74_NATGS|nr:GTP-binding protein [Natronobacterium gregoryi]AFZ72517.1 putative GTPase, G3E family [Natronobacterium gregoryi SP2]PLK21486.1 GTP-binding protein [Natronobacterium gregoryi SP2]SFI76618.1 GTPase, G3E family [Natronobacterium gregoryi]